MRQANGAMLYEADLTAPADKPAPLGPVIHVYAASEQEYDKLVAAEKEGRLVPLEIDRPRRKR